MREIFINIQNGYKIFIQKGILKNTGKLVSKLFSGERKIIIFSDSDVAPIYSQVVIKSLKEYGFDTYLYIIKAGEEHKNLEEIKKMLEFMAEQGFCREDLAIALGGGVVGDMTGFAASIYLRGISFIQIPTTLLSQLDSCVGGKTGVDLEYGKNLVGTFYQPTLVIIDCETLKTLDKKIYADGIAEAVKYACIADGELFTILEGHEYDIEDIIYRCLKIKAAFTEKDERESSIRKHLNFGHTVGHAIEKIGDFREYSHGQAVSIGMCKITLASEKTGITKKGTYKKISSLLESFGLPVKTSIQNTDISRQIKFDKKRHGNNITAVVLDKIGTSRLIDIPCDKFCDFISE